jgi:hypothetical protein
MSHPLRNVNAMGVTLTVEAGPEAFALLRDVVATAKAGDPLAAVTVAVPSTFAGLAARRRLAGEGRGIVNVGFLVLDRVAELVGAPSLAAAGRRPLTRPIAAEALRAELALQPGGFAVAAAHPATERSLGAAFAELRLCTPATLDRLAATSARAGDLVRLFRAWRARLAPDWYDEHDLADAAAAVLRDGTAATDAIGRLVVFLPGVLTPAQRRLVEAFGAAATVIEAAPSATMPATEVVSAVDADDEVRTAVRAVMEHLRAGIPLHRMAILYGGRDPYARLLARHLDAARVPWNGPAARTLAETAAGTALLGLLALPDRNWRRAELIGWLSSAPIVGDDGRRVPAPRWDTLSRRAGVIEGLDQWDERLAAHAAWITDQLNGVDGDEDDDAAFVQRRRRELDDTAALRLFVANLAIAVDPAGATTWTELAGWATGLLDRYLGDGGARRDWPETELDARASVRDSVQALEGLDVVGFPTDAATFRRAAERELDAAAKRVGRFGDGVFVAPVARSSGLDLDTVFVLGLSEGTLPAPPPGDALLPEHERARAGQELSGGPAPIDEQRRALVHGLAAARLHRVLLCPRTDLRRGRALLPSRWLLEAASNLAGEAVFSDDLDRVAAATPAISVMASFDAGVAGAVEPASLHERDLQRLLVWTRAGGDPTLHPLARDEPALGAGLGAAAARESTAFTAYDGNVAPGTVVLGGPGGEVLSPTSLEQYAQCPRRFLFSRILRVRPVDKPEEITRLSARDKGTMIHAVLEQYVATLIAGEARSVGRLLAIGDAVGRDFESKGITGKALCWRYDRQLIRRELRRFFALDDLVPLAVELPFGGEGEVAPVEVTVGGRRLAFRGVADRVDRGADGHLVVTDYKTGGDHGLRTLTRADPVARGTRLQLVLYGLAARLAFGVDAPVYSRYWFVSEAAGFRDVGYEVDAPVVEQFEAALDVIVAGVEAGVFPARPGPVDSRPWGTFENCTYCDFASVCPSDRGRQWDRKRGDRALAAYVALAEGEPAGEDNA